MHLQLWKLLWQQKRRRQEGELLRGGSKALLGRKRRSTRQLVHHLPRPQRVEHCGDVGFSGALVEGAVEGPEDGEIVIGGAGGLIAEAVERVFHVRQVATLHAFGR